MIVLGALLVLLAVLVIVAAAARANDAATLDLVLFSVNTTAVGIFLAGAVTLLVLVLGLWLIASGLRRARKKRAEVKALRRQAQDSEQRSSERDSRPVAPPRGRRGEKRRGREEPAGTREHPQGTREEPVVTREPVESAPPADRPPSREGPDEH